jgi:hypothetical protein
MKKPENIFDAAEQLAEIGRLVLADYKAEIRRNHVLTNKKAELDFEQLPLVTGLSDALQNWQEFYQHFKDNMQTTV